MDHQLRNPTGFICRMAAAPRAAVKVFCSVLLAALVLAMTCTITEARAEETDSPVSAFERFLPTHEPGDPFIENKYEVDIMHPLNNATFFAGQEVRLRIRTWYFEPESSANISAFLRSAHNAKIPVSITGNTSVFPAFNHSGKVHVRVIPAYTDRSTTSGTVTSCLYHSDVWADAQQLSVRAMAWGNSLAFSAHTSFVVPPFAWKLCVRDDMRYNRTKLMTHTGRWAEFHNDPGVQRFLEPRYLYRSSSTMNVGDFAAIKIVVNGRHRTMTYNGNSFDAHDRFTSGADLARGDTVKLVPAGFPCTYEKATASPDLVHNLHIELATTTAQFCGSNYVRATSGTWVNLGCVYEGSVADGVARTGSGEANPWATHSGATVDGGAIPSGVPLVAFLRLPGAGSYDVCVSPRAYRLALLNVTLSPETRQFFNAVPVWFKAYAASSSTCPSMDTELASSTCQPRQTALTITTSNHGMAFWPSTTIPGAWGTVRVNGTGLSTEAATSWEYSSPREFYMTTGGDQFRLVRDSAFVDASAAAAGEVIQRPDGTRHTISGDGASAGLLRAEATWTSSMDLTTTGEGSYTQRVLGAPAQGTAMSSAGCWLTEDNFGGAWATSNGNPGTQCCTTDSVGTCTSASCSMSDRDHLGATSSGDLGNNPRTPYDPWTQDSAGLTETFAYVRLLAGHWRVCYRKAGEENWRALPHGETGETTLMTLGRVNMSYVLNDTSAETLAQVAVHSSAATLTTLMNNIYTATSDSDIVGYPLKVVTTNEDCMRTNPGSRMSVPKLGDPECTIAHCGNSATCAGCQGPGAESVVGTHVAYGNVMLPSTSTFPGTFRMCLRDKTTWFELPFDTRTLPRASVTNTEHFQVQSRHRVYYELDDTRTGTWGRFVFRREAVGTPFLRPVTGIHGDVFRLVPNRTSGGQQTTCSSTWSVSSTVFAPFVEQGYNPNLAIADLGLWCQSSSSAAGCTSSKIAPTDSNGAVGTFPYADVDSYDDSEYVDDTDGTAGFLTLPEASTVSGKAYRVCYRQGLDNWIEAIPLDHFRPRFLTVHANTQYSLSVGASTLYAGMHTYFTVTAPSDAPIDRGTHIVKLVPNADGCDRAAAGNTPAWAKYVSMARSGTTNGGAVIVDDTSFSSTLQPNTATSMRFYMTLPTQNSTSASVNSFKVCHMSRVGSEANRNWQALGTVAVTSLGITFDAVSQPLQRGVTKLRVRSTSHKLNVTNGGDQLKVVTYTSPCTAYDLLPGDVTSTSALIEHEGLDAATQSEGMRNLGPSDSPESLIATTNVTMPSSQGFYRVCYKPYGLPWMSLDLAPLSDQGYALDQDYGLNVDPSGMSSMTISSSAQSLSPTDPSTYGTSTTYTTTVTGGLALYDGTNKLLTIDAGQPVMLTGDTFKFVMVASESTPGVFQDVPDVNCGSSGVEGNVTVESASAGYVSAMAPTTAGKYLFCFRRAANNTWLQLSATNSIVGNPFTVVPSSLWFTIDPAARTVQIDDRFSRDGTSFGGLVAGDEVYIGSATAVCGVDADVQAVVASAAGTALSSSSINATYTSRRTTPAISWMTTAFFSTNDGPFIVCVYRSQESTTYTSGTTPYLRTGWYQAVNAEIATGLGSGFYSPASPTAVVIDSCPAFNTTNTIRTGSGFAVTASIVDSNGRVVRSGIGTHSYLVTATGAFSMTNAVGQCRPENAEAFGWPESNLRQFTSEGTTTFNIVPTSDCPAGGCVLSFVSTGLTTSQTCTFGVTPTVVDSLRATAFTSECVPGVPCSLRVTGFHTDGDVAHTATDVISYATSLNGIGLTLRNEDSGASASGASGSVGSLSQGFADLQATFSISNAAAFTADATVTIILTAASGASTSVSVTVLRPTVTGVHIVDLYPSTPTEAPMRADSFVDPRLVPTWEGEAAYFGGGFAAVTGNSTIQAAAGYHLVAQQFYTVRLRLVVEVRGVTEYLSDFGLLDAASRSVSMAISAADGTAATGNEIIAHSADCETDDGCATPFTSFTLSGVESTIKFRLKNARGCSPSAGGCNITFLFGGSVLGTTPTSILTPVRSIATKLDFDCWAAPGYADANLTIDRSVLGVASTSACPPTAVAAGWLIDVRAVDEFGDVDEYFAGQVLPYVTVPFAVAGRTKASFVSNLLNTSTTVVPAVTVTVVAGRATFERLTLTQPCAAGCLLELFTTYGTGVTQVGALVTTGSTHHLECELMTPLVSCATPSDGCASVTGAFTYSDTVPSDNEVAAIYPDTTVCYRAFAADVNGRPTRYDTSWVHFAIKTNGTITPRDPESGAEARRYIPLNRGAAIFCFKADAGSLQTSFDIEFIAQLFDSSGHWSQGNTGRCTLGHFNVFPTKVAGGVQVDSIVVPDATITNTQSSSPKILYSISPTAGSYREARITLSATDYYGNSISSSNVHAADADVQVVIEGCRLDNLNSTCIQGTLNAPSGSPLVQARFDPRVFGALTVNIPSTPQSRVNVGAITYSVRMLKFCMECSYSFVLQRPGNELVNSSVDIVQQGNGTSYGRTFRATVSVNAIVANDATASRYVGLMAGSSPYRGHWTKHFAQGDLYTIRTSHVALFNASCLRAGSGCEPLESYFMESTCGVSPGAQTTLDADSSGNPLKFLVASGETGQSVNTHMELDCVSDNCEDASRVGYMADITTTYTVSVSIGEQLLACTNGPCIDDGTIAPKRIIEAYGTTIASAVENFMLAGGVARTADFALQGLESSTYQPLNNSYYNGTVPPSRSGSVSASATTSLTGIFVTSMSDPTYLLAWRGAKMGKRLEFLDTSGNSECPQTSKLQCLSGDSGLCAFTGYEQELTLSELAVNYTSGAFVGVPIPITVDVVGTDGSRTFGASGTVTISLFSWSGCNNGGTITVANGGSVLVDGRITSMVTFSAPCEACVLRAVLTPGNDEVYTTMLTSPSSFIALSTPISVVETAPVATHLLVTTPPASLQHTLTVADVTSVDFKSVSHLGNLQLDSASPVIATAYIRPASGAPAFDQYWYGNGGFLRPSTSSPFATRHTASVQSASGAGVLSFAFTRTCRMGCSVSVYFEFAASGASGAFQLRNSHADNKFFVFTALATTVAVGLRPRAIRVGNLFGVTQWHFGSELATASANPIAIAGVANGTFGSPNIPSVQVLDATNGDGGQLSTTTLTFPSAEVHLMRLTRPCHTCTLRIGSHTAIQVGVVTTGTFIRIAPFSWTGVYATALTNTFSLTAVDDLGYVDLLFGGNSNCGLWMPFECAANSVGAPIDFSLGSPIAAGDSLAFTPYTLPTGVNGTMSSGVASVPVSFVSPVRQAEPVFTASYRGRTLRSSTTQVVDVSVTGTAGEVQISAPNQGRAFLPMVVQVVMTKNINSVAYVDTLATNSITLGFSSCPTVVSSSIGGVSGALDRGALNITIVFSNPASSVTQCRVTATADATSGTSCSACSASTSFTLDPSFGSKWAYTRPTMLDNHGAPAQPLYGAVGRPQTVVVQLFADGPDGEFAVGSCDDPNTAEVETCSASVAANGCDPAPTIASAAFNATGAAVFTVTYASGAAGQLYSCPLQVTVLRAGSDLPAVAANFTTPTVEVCQPTALRVVSNFSAAVRYFFTGEVYPVTVAAVNAYGQQCNGETGPDAMQVSMGLVDEFTPGSPMILIGAVNTNLSSYTRVAVATATNGYSPSNTARLIGGSFTFSVMFSNATEEYGLRAVRLRFAAVGSSTFEPVFSNAVQTSFGAARLTIQPHLPQYAVVGRRVTDPVTGSTLYTVSAVDGVPAAWVAQGLLPGGPSVVRAPHPGATARFSWLLDPAGTFPLSLNGRTSPDGALVDGRAEYDNVVWTGAAATVGFSAISNDAVAELLPAAQQTVTFQSMSRLVINRTRWNEASPYCLASPCTLPLVPNADGSAYSTDGGSRLTLTVEIQDVVGSRLLGDHESVVEVYLPNAPGTARIVDASRPTSSDPVTMRMVAGRATVQIVLLGTTGNTTSVPLGFRCPATRPSRLLKPGEFNTSLANPCASLSELESYPITIIDTRPPRAAFYSGAALNATRVIRARSASTDLSRSRFTQLEADLALRMNRDFGLSFVEPSNAEGVISALACTVNPARFSFFNDLGSSVCAADPLTGNPQCSSEHPGTRAACPPAVSQCLCPSASAASRKLHVMLQRYLLQAAANETAANFTESQIEVTFRLDRASAFTGTTSADIAAALTNLSSVAEELLRSPYFETQFQIDPLSVGTRGAVEGINTVAPITPAPTVTVPAVATPAPIIVTTEPPVVSSAPQLSHAAAGLLLAFLALFALFA